MEKAAKGGLRSLKMNQASKNLFPLEIKQVGIVVKDREKSIEQIRSLLGVEAFRIVDLDLPEAIVRGKRTRCRAKLAFAQVGPLEVEFIEPGEGESIWSEFLEARGEGVQHLGIFVPDLDRNLARLRELGIQELQSGEDDHVRFSYLDTEAIVGVIIELLQLK
jgi:hypothetical protein